MIRQLVSAVDSLEIGGSETSVTIYQKTRREIPDFRRLLLTLFQI
jgi:hypothetical protein